MSGNSRPYDSFIVSESGDILTIYSTSPVSAVVGTNSSHGPFTPGNHVEAHHTQKHQQSLTLTEAISSVKDPRELLSLHDVKQLVYMYVKRKPCQFGLTSASFRERILNFIPVFGQDDFEISSLVNRHTDLAHCICYVTSMFLPGGSATANLLRPLVSNFILEKCTRTVGDAEEQLRTLQALMILYAYARALTAGPPSQHPFPGSLLKGLVEGYAMNFGLHRAVEGVKAAVRSGTADITMLDDYKKYTYWLWLYTTSHQ